MTKQPWYKRLSWIRLIITVIALILVAFGVALISFGSSSTLNDITFAILTGVSFVITLLAWFFPFSPKQSGSHLLTLANSLVAKSFSMGDDAAATFPYIIGPILYIYQRAESALLKSKKGSSTKHGILILGEANAGKTRLAFELMTKTLPRWPVLRWYPGYSLDKALTEEILNRKHLVLFLDDLQNYVLTQRKETSTVLKNIP